MSAQTIAPPPLSTSPDRHLARIQRFAPGDPGRGEAESFVALRYRSVHQATGCHFLENLVAVFDADRGCQGVIGLALAARTPLFVESYLDAPIEDLVTGLEGSPASRHRIAEVGNLASQDPRAGFALILWSIAWFSSQDVDWAVFCATRQVRERLDGLGIGLRQLSPARPERLGADAACWGRYYANDPRVVVARLDEARKVVALAPPELALLAADACVDGRREVTP